MSDKFFSPIYHDGARTLFFNKKINRDKESSLKVTDEKV